MDPAVTAESDKALREANKRDNAMWKMWRYCERNSVLALSGSPNDSNITGFLVFRGVVQMRLPLWLEKATFEIEDSSEIVRDELPQAEMVRPRMLVGIVSEGKRFYVVAEKVTFYDIEPDTYA